MGKRFLAAAVVLVMQLFVVANASAFTADLCTSTCTGGKPILSGSGGMSQPEVIPIFWGAWPITQTPNQGQTIGAIQALVNGPYFSLLTQYGNVGQPRMVPLTAHYTAPIPSNFTPTDMQNAINAEIDANVIPPPNGGADMVYAVFLPPNTTSTAYGGGKAGGWNAHLAHNGVSYKYLWVTDTSSQPFGATEAQAFAHELVESITNVSVTNCGTDYTQLADLCTCMTQSGWLNGALAVSGYWSAKDNKCVVPNAWQTIFQYSGTPGNWSVIGGDAHQVVAGPYGLLATDENEDPVLFNGSTWTQIGTTGAMYAVGSTGVIGLAADASSVFVYNGSTWTLAGGAASFIYASSVANSNQYFANDWTGLPYKYNGGTSWTPIGGIGDQFVATASWFIGLSPNHQQVNLWNGGNSWQKIANGASQIFGGPSSNILGGVSLDSSKRVGDWGIGNTDFVVQGSARSSSAIVGSSSGQALYGVSTDHSQVLQSTNLSATNPPWNQVGGAAGRIVGGGKSLYAVQGVLY